MHNSDIEDLIGMCDLLEKLNNSYLQAKSMGLLEGTGVLNLRNPPEENIDVENYRSAINNIEKSIVLLSEGIKTKIEKEVRNVSKN